jgi:hypothetical protein
MTALFLLTPTRPRMRGRSLARRRGTREVPSRLVEATREMGATSRPASLVGATARGAAEPRRRIHGEGRPPQCRCSAKPRRAPSIAAGQSEKTDGRRPKPIARRPTKTLRRASDRNDGLHLEQCVVIEMAGDHVVGREIAQRRKIDVAGPLHHVGATRLKRAPGRGIGR